MQAINEFYAQLTHPHRVVITTHQKPDGDALGSSLALYHFLKQLGHQPTVIAPTNWPAFLDWLPGCAEVLDFENKKHTQTAIEHIQQAEVIYCLDFNVLHRTKQMESALKAANATKIIIDHHEQPDEAAFDFGASNTYKSSTCEMVYDFIVEAGYSNYINLNIATCLYTGLMTDTGSFRFKSTTASVHKIVAHLKELGLNHSIIHEKIYDTFLENRLRFFGNCLLNRLDVLYEYNTAFMAIPKADLIKFQIKTGDTEGLVNYLLSLEGIKFGALVIDRDEERKWSFRSKGNFDVNLFSRKHFEGGGHLNAAGGRSADTLEETVKKFKQILPLYKEQLQ